MSIPNPSVSTTFDREMMQKCIQLASRAKGQTAPNPLVGSAIVAQGKIVGVGFHPGPGQPHAEVFALKEAGELARGSTLYVNLEPCNHYGRTPPCTEAIIAAGIAKVVVGIVDPDPRVSGKGIQKLRHAGIEVIVGVEEEACGQLNEGFIHRINYGRPFGILKYAMTLDGKIATTTGHSKWITSKLARTRVHQLRAACDAVIVGGNTVRRDNPHLTTHQVPGPNPLRVVMSRSLALPEDLNLWQTDIAPTIVLTETNTNSKLQTEGRGSLPQYLVARGVEIVEFNHLTPMKAMEYLSQRGINTVLWECGGVLAGEAIASQTVQKIMAFIAPKIIGGQTAPSPIGDLGLTDMLAAVTLDSIKWESIGGDLLIEGYLVDS